MFRTLKNGQMYREIKIKNAYGNTSSSGLHTTEQNCKKNKNLKKEKKNNLPYILG